MKQSIKRQTSRLLCAARKASSNLAISRLQIHKRLLGFQVAEPKIALDNGEYAANALVLSLQYPIRS
jgi:hypothetical protein